MFAIPIYDYSNQDARLGDTYRFTFKVKFKILGLEELFIKNFVEKGGKFVVENSYYDENGNYIVEAKVIGCPLPFLAVFGIIVAGSTLLLTVLGLQLTKVEKIIDVTASSVLPYVIIIFIGWQVLRLFK